MAERGGKRENAGRKTKAQELGLAELIDSIWTIPKQKHVLKQLVVDCNSSDFHQRHEARKLLLSYKFGKPTERREITGANGGAIETTATLILDFNGANDET